MTNGNTHVIKWLVYLLPVNPSCIHVVFEVETFVNFCSNTKINMFKC